MCLPTANGRRLRRIASETGGRFLAIEDFGDLLDPLANVARPGRRQEHNSRDLLAPLRWPLVLLAIGLLAAEWTLRKRKNLV